MNKLNKTILPNKNGRKSASGITLIALVITIIVLLILAGITIAQLTGSDSAPAKANEAKQKNDIGAARDQVYLFASNAQTEAYETVYVKGKKTDNSGDDVTAGGAGTEVSNYVKSMLKQEYPENGTKKVGLATIVATDDGATITITISTKDWKQEGTVSNTGGTLTWGELSQNIPTPEPVEDTGGDPTAPNSVQSLAKITGTIQVGDKVNYNPGTATSASLNLPEIASIDGTISASDYSDWRVLSVNQTTGEVLIRPYQHTNWDANLVLNIVGESDDDFDANHDYSLEISAMNMVAQIFKNTDYAKNARCVKIEDFEVYESGEILENFTYEDNKIIYPDSNPTPSTSIWGIADELSWSWLANEFVTTDNENWIFYVYDCNPIYGAGLTSCNVIPVITLKSGIQMTKDGNDVWQLSRGE